MYDYQIREAFHAKILKKAHDDNNTLVVNELGIQNGSFRADIAILNGKLEGFEIKSEYDNLERLPNQVSAYNSIFDRASIIICEKYLDRCKVLLPEWWGIYIARPAKKQDSNIIFRNFRAAKINRSIDGYAIARLLWRDEALDLAREYAEEKYLAKARRHEIYEILADNVKSKKLSQMVISKLKQRSSWRANH